MSLVRTVMGLLTLGAVALGTAAVPSRDAQAAASPVPAPAAETADTGLWTLPIFEEADPVAVAADVDATAVQPEPEPGGQTSGSSGGGGMPNPPGMVNGTFPGLVWAVADVREVRSAVNAFRSSKGLPALGAPFGSCADRGVTATPAFGIPAGTTHGKLLVKQNAAFLSAVPKDGGIMTADIAAAGDTDITGTFRPNSTVLLRLYECGASTTDSYFSPPPPNEPDPQPAPSPQPTPTPTPTAPAPTPPAPPAPTDPSPSPSPTDSSASEAPPEPPTP
jgi:hypothetical protein